MTSGDVVERVRAQLRAEADGRDVREQDVRRLARDTAPLLSSAHLDEVVQRVLADVRGLGPLEPLLSDDAITEIMVNGTGEVFVERLGRLEETSIKLDEATVIALAERIIVPLGLRLDRTSPLVDARLDDGSRVNVITRPLAVDGPCITIRRFGARAVSISQFTNDATIALLRWAIDARLNILVAGGTGAGKTTLLNALSTFIARTDRIVTIEDTVELRLSQPHVIRLEARPANGEGVGKVTIRDLVRNALRMRPDRLLVGEVRGPEALDMVQAMNTGHEGSLSTCHANSPADALRRLETMILMAGIDLPLFAIREQLSSTIDLIVCVSRGANGERSITEVAEVVAEPAEGSPRTRSLAGAEGWLSNPSRPSRCPGVPILGATT